MGPAFLEVSEHLLADGKQWMNSICCSSCMHIFDFTYYTAFVSTKSSCMFTFHIISLILLGLSEQAAVW